MIPKYRHIAELIKRGRECPGSVFVKNGYIWTVGHPVKRGRRKPTLNPMYWVGDRFRDLHSDRVTPWDELDKRMKRGFFLIRG